MSSNLRIQLFGGFRLAMGEDIIPPIATLKARSLFAYLIMHPGRAHTRDLLAGLFWPDLPDAVARRRLSQALWRIRQPFRITDAPFPLHVTANDVQFDDYFNHWLDVAAFEAALEADGEEGARMAAALYTGDFMNGFYDDWIIPERERLREHYLDALENLVIWCKEAGEYEEALHFARQLSLAEPLRESAHAQIMRLSRLLGRPQEALQQYEMLKNILSSELGVAPSAAVADLYRHLLTDEDRSFSPSASMRSAAPFLDIPSSIPLVGREAELARLIAGVNAAVHGRGGFAVVVGEAGVGKSRLLREVAREADWLGVQSLWGWAQDRGGSSPYDLWTQLLQAGVTPLRAAQLESWMEDVWLSALGVLLPDRDSLWPGLPEQITLDPEQEQKRVHEALIRVLLALGRISPHLLILEDLHWADEASLAALLKLVQRLSKSRLFVIISFRKAEAQARPEIWNVLQKVSASQGCERIELARLTDEEARKLVQLGLNLRRPAPRFTRRLYQETGGNPLFVLETLRALHDQGILYQDESGVWNTPWDAVTTDYAELPVSPGVQQVIARRLEKLGSAERSLLNATAILGDRFDFTLASLVAGEESKACVNAAKTLVLRRFWDEEPDAYRFSHNLVRQVVLMEMSEAEKERWHNAAFFVMEEARPDLIEDLAYHAEAGGLWREALHYHHLAAQQTEALSSYAASLEHWRQCLAIAPHLALSDEDHFDLLAGRERVLDILGRRQEQEEDIAAMLALAADDPLRKSQAMQRQARYLCELSRYAEAETAAKQALSLVRTRGELVAEHNALLTLSHIYNRWGKLDEALPPLQEALSLAVAAASLPLQALTNLELGDVMLGLGRHAEATALLETALALAREQQNRRCEIDALHLLAIIAIEQGDFVRADDLLGEELMLCREMGFLYGEGRVLLNRGNLYNLQGHAYQALHHYDAAIDVFQKLQNARGLALARLNRVSQHIALFGAGPVDFEMVAQVMNYAREVDDDVTIAQCQSIMGACHLAQGDYEQAAAWLRRGAENLVSVGQLWMASQNCRELARCYLESGLVEEAAHSLDRAETLLADVGATDADPAILILRARLACQRGHLNRALADSRTAVDILPPNQEQRRLILFWRSQILAAAGRSQEANLVLRLARDALQDALQDFPPDLRARSLTHHPEHRRIMVALATQTTVREQRLPAIGAPTGRPLTAEEWRVVHWTVHHPEDNLIHGKAARRQRRILRLLHEAAEQGAAPRVIDLARALEVSSKTIKRDLSALRAAGRDVRTRGSRG